MSDSRRLEELRRAFSAEPIVNIPVPFAFELQEFGYGVAKVSTQIAPGMLVGNIGIVNGGIMDTLANTAAVYAAMSVIPEGHTPRTSFFVNNLRKAREGETLLAIARMVEESDNSVIVAFSVKGTGPFNIKATGQASYHKPFNKKQ